MVEQEYDNLWADVISVERPHQLVPFPRVNPKTGKEFEVAMVVLTAEENAIVVVNAERKVRQLLKEDIPKDADAKAGYTELYNEFLAEGLLYETTRLPHDIKKKFFPTKQSISQALTMDEIAILLNHYYSVQTYMGPAISELSSEALEEWINRIKEVGSKPPFLLNFCTLEVLKALVMHSVSQLQALQTSSSSSSLPQEEDTKNIENLSKTILKPQRK